MEVNKENKPKLASTVILVANFPQSDSQNKWKFLMGFKNLFLKIKLKIKLYLKKYSKKAF